MPRAALRRVAGAADDVRRLPASLPARLPRPADPAEGAAVGPQLRRRGGAQRARPLVGPAPRASYAAGRGSPAGQRLAHRRLPRRPAAARRPGAVAGAGRALPRRRRPRRRADRHRAHGLRADRAGLAVGPRRPHRRPAARASWSWTTRPAARCSPSTTRAPRSRSRCTPPGPPAPCTGPARGSSCTTCRPATWWRGSTPRSRSTGTCSGRTRWPPSSRGLDERFQAGMSAEEADEVVPGAGRRRSAAGATSGPCAARAGGAAASAVGRRRRVLSRQRLLAAQPLEPGLHGRRRVARGDR